MFPQTIYILHFIEPVMPTGIILLSLLLDQASGELKLECKETDCVIPSAADERRQRGWRRRGEQEAER